MKKRRRTQQSSILEAFVDPLFGAFGAFLFIFLMVILMLVNVDVRDPEILTKDLPHAYNAMPYRLALSAREGMGHYKWSLMKGELPQGLELTSDGYLEGRPLVPADEWLSPARQPRRSRRSRGRRRSRGADEQSISLDKKIYEFTVEVDSRRRVRESSPTYRSYELHLFRDMPKEKFQIRPLQILTNSKLPIALNKNEYALSLSAVGGLSPYSWRLSTGSALPNGLDLDEEHGVIAGTPQPRRAGRFNFSLIVRDSRRSEAEKNFILDVVPHHPPPADLKILSTFLPSGIKGQPYFTALSAEGGHPPYSWKVKGLPPGVSFDANKNTLSGSPKVEGHYRISLAVSGSRGGSDRLRQPILVPVRSGEIVRWWKVIAFLLLYLSYLALCQIWSSNITRIDSKLFRKWRMTGKQSEVGRMTVESALGPRATRRYVELYDDMRGQIGLCTGSSADILSVLRTLLHLVKFEIIDAAKELFSLFRCLLATMGYWLFFFVSRDEVKFWPLIISAGIFLWACQKLWAAWRTLKEEPPSSPESSFGSKGDMPDPEDFLRFLRQLRNKKDSDD